MFCAFDSPTTHTANLHQLEISWAKHPTKMILDRPIEQNVPRPADPLTKNCDGVPWHLMPCSRNSDRGFITRPHCPWTNRTTLIDLVAAVNLVTLDHPHHSCHLRYRCYMYRSRHRYHLMTLIILIAEIKIKAPVPSSGLTRPPYQLHHCFHSWSLMRNISIRRCNPFWPAHRTNWGRWQRW